MGLEIQLRQWVSGKPAAPRGTRPYSGLAVNHCVTQRSPHTDPAAARSRSGEDGMHYNRNNSRDDRGPLVFITLSVLQAML